MSVKTKTPVEGEHKNVQTEIATSKRQQFFPSRDVRMK